MFWWIYFLMGFVFVFVLLCGFVACYCVEIDKNRKRAKLQKSVNEKMTAEMQAHNFLATRIFYFSDRSAFNKPNEYKQILAVDSENKKLGLIDYESGSFREVKFADIVNYELYENGAMLTSGMGIGGMFSMQTTGECKELKLIIRINQLECPQHVYEIVSTKGIVNFGIGKNSQIYRMLFPTVQEVVSLLQVILNENKAAE